MEYLREEPLNKSKERNVFGWFGDKRSCKIEVLVLEVSNSETCMCACMTAMHLFVLSVWMA